ncbi:MAG: HAMP domain-containing sensor histidine kinase [Saprospiraceae bacterium]|nr:HAMP domain-containing histidine kinase [Saprospiraceae bacterium]MBP7642638.1 HAMP domain-containing histidine kinase [Saprospiraceae bacterium]
MSDNKFLRLLILGSVAIVGIIAVQSYWLLKTWDLKDQEFDTTMHIALQKVAIGIAKYNDTALPKTNLIQRRSSNIYAVNVNSAIDPRILEDFLYQEFTNFSLNTDFEYAVYDCHSDELVYGNYCKFSNQESLGPPANLPKFEDLIYYFVIKLPQKESFLLSNFKQNIFLALVAVLALSYFIFSFLAISRQKKLSALQADFINNMTHEFKTPLSSIKIASQALRSHLSIQENEKLQRYADIIFAQNERLNSQVERVLNVAKVEGEEMQLDLSKFNVAQVTSKIVSDENAKYGSNIVSFQNSTKEAAILADEVHFTNVVHNILDNSIKYSKEVPNISMMLKNDEITGDLILEVNDQGIGIDKENLKRVFEKFYRVNTGNRHDIKGFGLGLFYVKNICDAHGWSIHLSSEMGVGTQIKITQKSQKNGGK